MSNLWWVPALLMAIPIAAVGTSGIYLSYRNDYTTKKKRKVLK